MIKPAKTHPLILSIILLMALLGPSHSVLGQQNAADIVIGKRVIFHSKIFNRDLTLSISLPADYETSAAKYAVLYDTNAFINFNQDAAAVEYLSSTGLSFMPEMIVVGVPYLGDYVPTPFEERDSTLKAADLSLKFFREDLIPFIDGTYRTSRFNLLFGHSVGGLFTMYALFTQPDLFSAGIASSPYFEALDQYWLKHVDQMFKAESLAYKHLYLAVGKKEREQTRNTFAELEKWMASKDLKGLTWKSAWLDGVDHMSMLGKSFYDGLLSIFDGWQFPFDIVMSADVAAIEEHTGQIRAKFGGLIDYKIPEDLLDETCRRLLERKSYDQAINLITLRVGLYPRSTKSYYDLAEIYAAKGDKESAKKYYDLYIRNCQDKTEPEKILLQIVKAKAHPSRASEKTLKMYPGVYGERTVFLENGVLSYQRTGRPKFRLIPLTETLYALDGYENFWIEFVVTDGKAAEIVGLYGDGRREPSHRTK